MKPTPNPIRRFKAAPRASSGQVNGTVDIVQTSDGEADALHSQEESTPVHGEPGPAMIGLSMGVTIPGPPKSYMSARIDAHCYLPCGTSDADIDAAYARAADKIQERLEQDSQTVNEFFAEAGRKG